METSLFLAKVFGILFAVIGLGFLINFKSYKKIYEDFFKNSALIYIGGFLALIMGTILVLCHNVWEGGWVVIITVLAWMSLIKGVCLLVFPNWFSKMKFYFMGKFCWFSGLLLLILGLFLLTKGFEIIF